MLLWRLPVKSQGSWLQGCSRNWNQFLINQEPSREVKKTKWDFYFFFSPPSFLGNRLGGRKKKRREKKYKLLQFSPKPGEGSRGQGAWGPPPEELLDDAVSKIFSARRTLTFSPFTLQGIFSCDSGNYASQSCATGVMRAIRPLLPSQTLFLCSRPQRRADPLDICVISFPGMCLPQTH